MLSSGQGHSGIRTVSTRSTSSSRHTIVNSQGIETPIPAGIPPLVPPAKPASSEGPGRCVSGRAASQLFFLRHLIIRLGHTDETSHAQISFFPSTAAIIIPAVLHNLLCIRLHLQDPQHNKHIRINLHTSRFSIATQAILHLLGKLN